MSEDSTCRSGAGETCILRHTFYSAFRPTAASNDLTWEEADESAVSAPGRDRGGDGRRADYAALNRLAAAARITTAPGSEGRREIDRAHAEVQASLDERAFEWLIYGLGINGQMELELWNDRFPCPSPHSAAVWKGVAARSARARHEPRPEVHAGGGCGRVGCLPSQARGPYPRPGARARALGDGHPAAVSTHVPGRVPDRDWVESL